MAVKRRVATVIHRETATGFEYRPDCPGHRYRGQWTASLFKAIARLCDHSERFHRRGARA